MGPVTNIWLQNILNEYIYQIEKFFIKLKLLKQWTTLALWLYVFWCTTMKEIQFSLIMKTNIYRKVEWNKVGCFKPNHFFLEKILQNAAYIKYYKNFAICVWFSMFSYRYSIEIAFNLNLIFNNLRRTFFLVDTIYLVEALNRISHIEMDSSPV